MYQPEIDFAKPHPTKVVRRFCRVLPNKYMWDHLEGFGEILHVYPCGNEFMVEYEGSEYVINKCRIELIDFTPPGY